MSQLLFIETNPSGLEAILKAKKQGHKVYFVSSDLSFYLKGKPIEDHPLSQVDQLVEVATTFDVEGLCEEILKHFPHTTFDAILTFNELHTNIVAHVAKRFGVKGVDPIAADRARNKEASRRLFVENNLLSPNYTFVQTVEQALDAAHSIGYPVIVKPVDGTGSLFVQVIHHAYEMKAYVQHFQGVSSFGRSVPVQKGFLVEEWVQGPLVSVETVTLDGKTIVLGITERKLTGYPYFIETASLFPAKLPQEIEIIETALLAIESIGIDFGFSHVELILSEKGPVLVEVNPRLAGGVIPDLIEVTTGMDSLQVALDLYLKGASTIHTETTKYAGSFHFTTPHGGRLKNLIGWHDVTNRNGVTKAFWMKPEGTLLKDLKSNFDRLGYIVVEGDSPESIREEILEIRQQIKLVIEHTV